MIDLHCDTISRLMKLSNLGLRQNSFSVDIQKLLTGKVMAQFFALYIDKQAVPDTLAYCLQMVDRFHCEIEANNEFIAIAQHGKDFNKCREQGKIAAFLTIEEGGVLQGEIANLRNFYRLGVRLITLTWNYPNEIGYPNYKGVYREKGLTEFGHEVVREMNRLGMIIDVSHLSDQGFYDVTAATCKPFVASHSNARAVTGHFRNLTDDMIRVLAEKGGVMGINFAADFLGSADASRIEDIIRHIRHIYKVGGIEVLAIGSDFDGIDSVLEIENSGQLPKLADALAATGFTAAEIEKVCWQNALRVINNVL